MNAFEIQPWEIGEAIHLDAIQSTAFCTTCTYQDITESGTTYHNGTITCPNCETSELVTGNWS